MNASLIKHERRMNSSATLAAKLNATLTANVTATLSANLAATLTAKIAKAHSL